MPRIDDFVKPEYLQPQNVFTLVIIIIALLSILPIILLPSSSCYDHILTMLLVTNSEYYEMLYSDIYIETFFESQITYH